MTVVADVPDADQHPALERITARIGVVACDRPVVSLSTAICSAIQAVVAARRGVQLLTPSTSRLTAVLRTVLAEVGGNWVVRKQNGELYEGLLGVPVRWDGTAFVVAGDGEQVRAFLGGRGDLGSQLTVVLRVRHTATAGTEVGGVVTALAKALTGAVPAGWGTAEPVTQPWREAELTAFARNRAPSDTRLTFRGSGERPFQGTVEITRVPSGVDEHVTAFTGLVAGEPPAADRLTDIARTVADRFALVSMLATVAPGRHDLTHGPHATTVGAPLAFTVGTEAVTGVTLAEALTPVEAVEAVALGAPTPRAVHYLLDGTDQERWRRLTLLVKHLTAPRRPVR